MEHQQLDYPSTESAPYETTPSPSSPPPFSSTSAVITPLLISAAGVTGTFLIIFAYHVIILRCCPRRRPLQAGAGGVTGAIPAVMYTPEDGGRCVPPPLDGKVNDCVICIVELKEGETVRFMPICGHVFHASCVDPWLSWHSNCPTCRAPIAPPGDDVASVC